MELNAQQMEEVKYMVTQLQTVLAADNNARKLAEAELNKIKEGDSDKYACYLTAVLMEANAPLDIKSLAAVILRRSLGTMVADKKQTLWEVLSQQAKDYLKNNLLNSVKAAETKDLMRKLANLLVEIAGGMYEQNEEIWQDLLNLIFVFVNAESNLQVDGALQMFNGLFSYIIDHLNKYQTDLIGIFRKTLNHNSLDIKLASLQAVSNYLQTVEQKDVKPLQQLIPDMYNVIRAAATEDDEVVLQDALIEFNEIAEIEPKFFQSKFKEIFQNTMDVVGKADFTNPLIRQQPIEFYVTVVERVPSIVKKDEELLKQMIELIFKLMIDIDESIEDEWMKPKEGFNDSGQAEEGEDNVNFGKSCIDKIISAVGEQKCLPLLSAIVDNTINNESDWRYKNAALMAFSQVGEYIDDIKNISAMVPIVLTHLKHPNAKVRFAALHCIGQISDDMTEEFQEEFGEQVLPILIETLNDPVPRVSAHCCSAITNFMDGATEELIEPHIGTISPILANLMKVGISIQKENSVTAFASTAVVIKEKFNAHFGEAVDLLLSCLNENPQPCYKQFRAQTIEAITLICSGVSPELFATKSNEIIQAMLYIQQSNLDDKDPQRSYLLSAWQRICLIMKTDFTPYLEQILPPILSMATLKPSMGVEGQGEAGLNDVLQELGSGEEGAKKSNVMTDEIEEKDSALQMLIVFIEELGGGFAQYIDQVSTILLGLTQFFGSDNIRNTSAGALPSLIKCAKEAAPNNISVIHDMAKKYSNNIIDAMETETETDCLIAQAQAVKEILEEAGPNLLQPESVDLFWKKILEFIQQSQNRIEENNKYEKENCEGDDDDKLDEEDLIVLKEENKSENELQVSLAECIGILFKTHGPHCRNLVQVLQSTVLPAVEADGSKQKQKFLLFILDDMVEFLGPDFLGPAYLAVAQKICSYASSKYSAIRQAAVYGIGMMAQHGGATFAQISQLCLESIRTAIEFPMDAATKEKKGKQTQYYHAKDNAVAALGKILKFQSTCADTNLLVEFWVQNLPLTHDMEEAKVQNEFLADTMLKAPGLILEDQGGALQVGRLEKLVMILGEVCHKKQSDEATIDKLAVVIANMSQNQAIAGQFQQLCDTKLSEEHKARVMSVYQKCNEEVRAKVQASL